MTKSLPQVNFPELFFGLVAPIGSIFEPTVESLTSHLEGFGYKVVPINVTDIFEVFSKHIVPTTELNLTSRYDRYKSFIQYGNQLRATLKDNSVLALAAIYQIFTERVRSKLETEKTAYIIRQFKRPEEIELLRSVYGNQFFQVSIYSTRPNRVSNLADLFAKDSGNPNPDTKLAQAQEVVQTDQDEDGVSVGQRVRKTFHNADFIVDGNTDAKNIEKQIERFVKLLFGSNNISPTKDEYGMKLAKSAALRSIDLSRQVGAAIFDQEGQIISLGSNEVPKGGGGTYWGGIDPANDQDAREYTKNTDSNDERKQELLKEILEILEAPNNQTILEKLSKSQIMDALEYGRVVHAEMSAITDAARKGVSIKNSNLYCTTFPCHMCAKHIVSAGIERVVFLEPYPKSLVARLHSDSIDVENMDRGKYKNFPSVKFEHFHGITPKKFDMLFARAKRKDENGKYKKSKNDPPSPLIVVRDKTYLALEERLIENINSMLSDTEASSV